MDAERYLASKGYLTRGVTNYGLPEHLRITIGEEQHCRDVVAAGAGSSRVTSFMGRTLFMARTLGDCVA